MSDALKTIDVDALSALTYWQFLDACHGVSQTRAMRDPEAILDLWDTLREIVGLEVPDWVQAAAAMSHHRERIGGGSA